MTNCRNSCVPSVYIKYWTAIQTVAGRTLTLLKATRLMNISLKQVLLVLLLANALHASHMQEQSIDDLFPHDRVIEVDITLDAD